MEIPRLSPRFETSDLNVAAFLRSRGFAIADLRPEDRGTGNRSAENQAVFGFTDSPQLRAAILDYANDSVVPVRSFCNTLRDLKGLARGSFASGGNGGSRER